MSKKTITLEIDDQTFIISTETIRTDFDIEDYIILQCQDEFNTKKIKYQLTKAGAKDLANEILRLAEE